MAASVALDIPRQIHDDIVILQGQEIIRIRGLLETTEPRLDALQDENEQLRTEHEQTLRELEDLRAQPPPESAIAEESGDQPIRLVSPRTVFLNQAKLPRYNNLQIPAFYVGRSPRKCLKYLKQVRDTKSSQHTLGSDTILGYLRIALFRGGEEEWQHGYNTCFIVRPESRRRRDGAWIATKLVRPQRSVQVISQIYGRWYYLGSYQCTEAVALDSSAYDLLSEQSKRGVLRFMAHGEFKDEARNRILEGEVRLTRIELHRVTFDEMNQRLLVTAGVKRLDEAESDRSRASDDDGDVYD
ncbi:hypothetical protein PHLGIDRAFT_125441 [Phlebiopsis gigantea 11061_1 CR5-6]|uniref:Uncharacterized protein n=1 Tax=Phlebiopsis gigantea (strain 11061_1 CR5-6) TaxID=745531 RepID=A0A0C3SEJ3_PHLG1|nr:hypothetical protein PHLGIDRAFT_125441 [Phlebiopsis gigantea 11061_1 CR5-6]